MRSIPAVATTKEAKAERLDVRLSRKHKLLIEEAAAIAGQPVTTFAVSTLIERAEQVLRQHGTTVLSARDRKVFLEILDNAEPNEALRRAASRFKARNA